MWNQFKTISLSHLNAPVEIRELIYLPGDACRQLLSQIHETLDLEEVLVLSTCNRTEIYYISEQDFSVELIKILCIQKGLENPAAYLPYFEVKNDAHSAVRHLFEVSMGLQSRVIGDLQISNQAKQAYSWCSEMKLAGPFLHRLMHNIFHTNKRVHLETAYRDGAASVSYASAELAMELMSVWEAPSVLVIGMGEMGRDVARNLKSAKLDQITISNRSFEKAEELAADIKVDAIPFAEAIQRVGEFDVVISAVNSSEPILNASHFVPPPAIKTKYLIDLAMPRSIAPEVEELGSLICYNIDEIQVRTNEVVEKRLAAIPEVNRIIDEEMSGFNEWSQELTISPTIHKLKQALEDIRKEELARYLKKADDKESELVDKVTKSMMNKIIKLPVLQLKAACKRGEQETLIDLLNDLFDLENTKVNH